MSIIFARAKHLFPVDDRSAGMLLCGRAACDSGIAPIAFRPGYLQFRQVTGGYCQKVARNISDEVIIGLHHNGIDPCWVQVEEAILQTAKASPVQIVPITSSVPGDTQDDNAKFTVVDELLALEVHAVIGWWWPEKLAIPVLDAGLPIVMASLSRRNTDILRTVSQ